MQFDEGRAELKFDSVTTESLRSFVSKHRLPLVVEFTQESAEQIFGGDQKVHLLLFVNKTKPDAQAHINTLQEVAPKFQGKVSIWPVLCVTSFTLHYRFFNVA